MAEKIYDFKVGDKVRLTGTKWATLSAEGSPKAGDIVTVIRVDDDGDRVFLGENVCRYYIYDEFSAELVTDEKPAVTVTFTHENGDRITMTNPRIEGAYWTGHTVTGNHLVLHKPEWTPEAKNYPDSTVFLRPNFHPLVVSNGVWYQIIAGAEGPKSRPARPHEIEKIVLGEGGTLLTPSDLMK